MAEHGLSERQPRPAAASATNSGSSLEKQNNRECENGSCPDSRTSKLPVSATWQMFTTDAEREH